MEREELKLALIRSVKKLTKNKKVALLLSGGIDSSVIAKIMIDNNIKFTAYTVDFNGPDTKIAERFAKELKIKHKIITFSGNPETLIKKVLKIIKTTDPVDIGVAMPILMAAKQAKRDKKEIIISGLGSDEVLAGYNSHAKAFQKGWKAVHKECERRLITVKKDIKRDKAVCKFTGIKPILPFMDKKVIDVAMKIHPKNKISNTKKKIILRKIAKEMGLPEYIYNRPKKAAQYGSGSLKIIKKLAKQKGFKFVRDYLLYSQNSFQSI